MRTMLFVFGFSILMSFFVTVFAQAQPAREVPLGGKRISDQLFGLFFEDINYASDGGLYAEMVQNRSFEYSPSMQGHWHPFSFWAFLKPGFSIGDLRVASHEPLHPNNPSYVILDAEFVGDYAAYEGLAGVGLKNVGYNGMSVKAGAVYNFSVFARQLSKNPVRFIVQLRSGSDEVLAVDSFKVSADRWQKYEGHMSVVADCDSASLVVLAQDNGRVALDMISLFPEETFMGRPNGLRADLARSIAALQPRFLRFPGGCLVHGDGIGNMYRWKNSVGPVEQRKAQRNIWGYQQSHGLGFFEYFQFCEDIGARALPVLPAGVSCQNSGGTHVIGGAGQKALCLTDMDTYIQDVLDLIEWATGPADSKWGAVRAAAGREAPFDLEFLGIGNEDKITPEFEQRFTMIYEAVRAAYPHIKLIATSGPFSDGDDFEKGWALARELDADLVDEHYYKGPEWLLSNLHRYDTYDRSGPKVYLGEYASWGNQLYNALAEAAYMIGLERNGDVVAMASYAPLMARKGNTQWSTDMLFFDDEQVVLTPNYHVQKMFMTNQGDWYFDDVVSCKQNDSLLAVSTVYDSSTGDVIIKLVNAGPEVHQVKANLSAFKHLGDQVQGSVLKGALEDANTFDHPNKIAPEDFVASLSDNKALTHTLAPRSVTVLRIMAEHRFTNPFKPQRADSQGVHTEDGAWYFNAAAPDFDLGRQ